MLRQSIALAAVVAGIVMMAQPLFSPSQVMTVQAADNNELGGKLYVKHCANCHGKDGKGGGPAAITLKKAIPDLTAIALRDGKFDGTRVKHCIAGEVGVSALGELDMPAWGRIFRYQFGQSASQVNVHALMRHLESLQQQRIG